MSSTWTKFLDTTPNKSQLASGDPEKKAAMEALSELKAMYEKVKSVKVSVKKKIKLLEADKGQNARVEGSLEELTSVAEQCVIIMDALVEYYRRTTPQYRQQDHW